MNEQSPQMAPLPLGKQIVIPKIGLGQIFEALGAAGYTIVGPTLGQEAIVYEEIDYPAPTQILNELSVLENEIQQGLADLKKMLA